LGDFPGIYARNQNRFLRSWPLGIQGVSDTQVPFRVEIASIQLLLRKAPGTRLHPGEQGILVHNASALPSTCSNPSDSKLRGDVIYIHQAFAQLHFLAKVLRTTTLGVLQDQDGKYYCVYSVSSNNVEGLQERATERDCSYVAGPDHAERNILAFAEKHCLKPIAIAPCRLACGPAKQDCDAAVRNSGAKLVNPQANSAGKTDRCINPED